ncbi:MAG: KH domain-containing protein [Christensenellales bacterium]
MKDLVEFLVRELVDDMTDVEITEIEKGNYTEINVALPSSQMGKVIGKQGRIAKAIRTVVKAAAGKDYKKYSVEITEKNA